MNLEELVPGPGQREIVAGGTRTGKSSYQDHETQIIQAIRPSAMQILVDTKPRFRAETEQVAYTGRRSAAWRYKSWAKGPVVPGGCLVNLHSPHPFRGLWRKPNEIAIMQSGEPEDWKLMLRLLKEFCKAQVGDRERRVVVDEALDFYQRNTLGIDSRNDVFYRIARAGGERNIGLSLGVHRLHGVPPLIIAMTNIVVVYHLRHDGDMKYLNEYGIPDRVSPKGDYVFRRYETGPGGVFGEPITGRCAYSDKYLEQLAAA